jgi:hypothetical protein
MYDLFILGFLFFTFLNIRLFSTLSIIFPFATTKQEAHYLSTVNSIILSIFAIYTNVQFFYYDYIISKFWQVLLISFFTSYLFCDLYLGILFYKRYIGFLTGYIHHTIYICVSFYSIWSDQTLLYCLYYIFEIPSVILCLGNLTPSLRMDKLFGISFFLVRILYHLFLISIYFLPSSIFPMLDNINRENILPIVIFTLSILNLHFYWFYKWYIKYS